MNAGPYLSTFQRNTIMIHDADSEPQRRSMHQIFTDVDAEHELVQTSVAYFSTKSSRKGHVLYQC